MEGFGKAEKNITFQNLSMQEIYSSKWELPSHFLFEELMFPFIVGMRFILTPLVLLSRDMSIIN